MTRTALVIGGTGPTGPHVLRGLLDRGFDVTIYHRGTHEPDGLPEVRHIHGDPHFSDQIQNDVGVGEYDVVLAAYGRTRLLADAFVGRAGHFLSIGGPPRYAGFYEPQQNKPSGPPIPISEDAPVVGVLDASAPKHLRFGRKLVETEMAVFASQPTATHLIYPMVYGPRNVVPLEWSVIQRVLDGRSRLLVPDDGLALHSRGGSRNLAEFVLLAIDHAEQAKGQVFNCADEYQLTLRQWIESILVAMNADVELVAVPSQIAPTFRSIYIPLSKHLCAHDYLDISKAKTRLGYRDVVRPADAIAESVAWYLAHPLDATSPPSSFVDRFDYRLEDDLIDRWTQFVDDTLTKHPQPEPEEVHPMPHPKQASQIVDERGR